MENILLYMRQKALSGVTFESYFRFMLVFALPQSYASDHKTRNCMYMPRLVKGACFSRRYTVMRYTIQIYENEDYDSHHSTDRSSLKYCSTQYTISNYSYTLVQNILNSHYSYLHCKLLIKLFE